MSNNCFVLECKYRNDPGYSCEMKPNRCLVHSLGPEAERFSSVTVEDKENVRTVLMYEAVAALTDGGNEKLYDLLRIQGFDTSEEITRYDHVEDKQVEYVQQREWQD